MFYGCIAPPASRHWPSSKCKFTQSARKSTLLKFRFFIQPTVAHKFPKGLTNVASVTDRHGNYFEL